jgi:nucleotide-binding universal stress UspA family protein
MAEDKDYLGEKLRLVERAREDTYFRRLDQELLAKMRQQDRPEPETVSEAQPLFPSILVPVDFSVYSTVALQYATGVAERFNASLIVLHVIAKDVETYATHHRLGQRGLPLLGPFVPSQQHEVPADIAEEVSVDLREQAYAALQAFLPPRCARYPVELRVLTGHPFERILETAMREHVSLIVLGTRGRTGLSHAIMGSVAERVVRLAPCPVLTVKAPTVEEHGWLQEFYGHFLAPQPTAVSPER